MTQTSLRHRHFVAMPLMAILLLGVGGLGTLTKAAIPDVPRSGEEEIVSQDEERQFSFTERSLSVLLQPHSKVTLLDRSQALRMEGGSATLKTSGLVSIDLGFGAVATLLLSSATFLKDTQSVTVVALTTPLIVSRAGSDWILPPQYQVRIASDGSVQRSKVPQEWFLDQQAESQALPVISLPQLTEDRTSLIEALLSSDAPSNDVLQSIRSLSDTDRRTLVAMFIDESSPEISFAKMNAAFTVADTFVDHRIQQLVFLRFLLLQDRMHEDTANSMTLRLASASFDPSEFVFAVPSTALSTLRPLSPSLIEAWTNIALESGALDPSRTASVLEPLLSRLPASYDMQGYPKQSMLWQEATARIAAVLTPLLSGERSISITSSVSTLPASVAESASSSSVAAQKSYTQEIERVRNFLLQKNVLFTTGTTIEFDSDVSGCMRVSDVYLADASSDQSFTFSLCLDDGMVRRIVRDGKKLPNDVSLLSFFR